MEEPKAKEVSAHVVKTVRFWFTPEVPDDQRKPVYQRLWALLRAFALDSAAPTVYTP